MGCFLACFGFSSRRKHPTSAHKFTSGDQSHGCYNKLLYKDIHNPSNPSFPDPRISDEDVNRCGVTFKKKVTFCSNVRTYEPIENEDCTSQVLENGKKEIHKEEEKGPSGEDSLTSQMKTYPSSYRYQNLRDNWYEEDQEEEDMIYEENDEMLADDDDDLKECNEEDSDDDDDIQDCNEEDSDDELYLPPVKSEDDEEEKIIITTRSRQHICPVLLPVENISQWRSMKAKHKREAKVTFESKENIKFIDQTRPDETGNWEAKV